MVQHPDWDIEFKPAIARYDWDQTYDVLEFVYLPQGFNQLVYLCGIPAFELMAIDRFTPYRYRWAEQYSDKLFNFLKPFNFSPHSSIFFRSLTSSDNQQVLSINYEGVYKYWYNTSKTIVGMGGERGWINDLPYSHGNMCRYNSEYYISTINGDNIGNIPSDGVGWQKVSIKLPAFEFNEEKYNFAEEYFINLPEGKYTISFLALQGGQEGLYSSIQTINQVFYCFTLKDSKDIDLNKIINFLLLDSDGTLLGTFCTNSIVISKFENDSWNEINVSSPKNYLFYKDIDSYFNTVTTQLNDYFANINDTYSLYWTGKYYVWEYTLLNLYPRILNSSRIYGHIYKLPYSSLPPQHTITEISIETSSGNYADVAPIEWLVEKIPDDLINLCSLRRANNNKWKTGNSTLSDLGYSRDITYRKSFYFDHPNNESGISWLICGTFDISTQHYGDFDVPIPRGIKLNEYSDLNPYFNQFNIDDTTYEPFFHPQRRFYPKHQEARLLDFLEDNKILYSVHNGVLYMPLLNYISKSTNSHLKAVPNEDNTERTWYYTTWEYGLRDKINPLVIEKKDTQSRGPYDYPPPSHIVTSKITFLSLSEIGQMINESMWDLNYLLQLKEEWEAFDKQLYEEEQNA